MRLVKTYTGTLQIIERLNNSHNGNPRYLLQVGTKVARTTPDSALAYGLTNYEGKRVEARIGLHYNVDSLESIEVAE